MDAEIFLLDGRTNQRLQTERLRAVLTGGVFGGSEDKIENELARRVILQTKYMLNGRIPPESRGTTSHDTTPTGLEPDQHTLTMNAKKWAKDKGSCNKKPPQGFG